MAEPGDVNNFRSNFEKLYREYMQQRPAALPGGGSGGPPAPPGGREMAPMPEGPGAQPGGRTYYSNVPSTNVRPPIDISEVSGARPVGARPMGGALGPSALAGLGALAQYLQQGPNPFGATLLPQIPGFSRNVQAPVSGYEMPETPRDISPMPEERGRDTGQNYGPARPQARQQRRAAAPVSVDPRFAQLLQRILSQPQAPAANRSDIEVGPNPYATGPNVGTSVSRSRFRLNPTNNLILDPMMGGGNA